MTVLENKPCLPRCMQMLALALWAAIALPFAGASAANAAEPPACAGVNLLDEVAARDPGAHARILAEADTQANGRAILWRVEGKGGVKPSWLFGTIHVTDDRVNLLTANAQSALDGADAIAIEIAGVADGDAAMAAAMQNMIGSIMFTDGRALGDFLDGDQSNRLTAALERVGMPGAMADALQPWFASVLLALPPCEVQRAAAGLKALDFRIEASANARGANVHGLETVEEQFAAMSGLPFESQLAWLKVSILLYDRAPDLLETMVQLYLDRRVGAIWPLNEHIAVAGGENREAIKLAMQEFQLRLVELRNLRMVERALPLIEAGGAFIAVGAAHLPGEKGLVELVRKAGYAVTAAE